MVLVGVDSIPIVSLIAIFIGLVLALQGAYQLQQFGAVFLVTALVWGLGMLAIYMVITWALIQMNAVASFANPDKLVTSLIPPILALRTVEV